MTGYSWVGLRYRKPGALDSVADLMSDEQQQAETSELYEQIGRLKMELEWLKKKAASLD